MNGKTIGERLVALRGTKSQAEVAEACGISVSAVGMYERDERVPRDEIKKKLANYFKVSVGSLFFD